MQGPCTPEPPACTFCQGLAEARQRAQLQPRPCPCAQDKLHIGPVLQAADTEPAVYILTLGVLPQWQQRGVASALLDLASRHARVQLR